MSDRTVTVTVKYGKGYEETWAVFKGNPEEVREDIISYFGADRASVAGLTLHELVVNVTALAHGVGNASAALGAVVIPSSGSSATPPAQPAAQPAAAAGTDVWAQAEAAVAQQQAVPAENPLLAQIEAAADVQALQMLWASNQEAFTDATVMAAWKAKGKALQAANG